MAWTRYEIDEKPGYSKPFYKTNVWRAFHNEKIRADS
jgi:hypothetical protein